MMFVHCCMQWRSQGHCFWGGQVASSKGILGGSAPQLLRGLDFSNGLQHNWGAIPPPLTMPLAAWLANFFILCKQGLPNEEYIE